MKIGPKLPVTAWKGCLDVGGTGQFFGGGHAGAQVHEGGGGHRAQRGLPVNAVGQI